MIEIFVATKNRGKLEEIGKLLTFTRGNMEVKLYCLSDFGITAECMENGKTFAENAAIKSLFYGKFQPGIYTVGDDSGLSVEALNGEPGIYSARYAGPEAIDDRNTAKLLDRLKNIENREARFVTAVCLSKNSEILAAFTGEVEGIIIDEKRGFNGFGYDPVFYYPPLKKTFAQLSTEEKNRISHRSRAFQQIKEFFKKVS
jgi:XTP/dITP diphosphohydrolase